MENENLPRKSHLRNYLILAGLIVLLVAVPTTILLSRKQQKAQSEAATPAPEICYANADIVVLFDVSSSMDELNKLNQAKEAFRQFVNSNKLELVDGTNGRKADGKTDRVALIPFNDVENTRNPANQVVLTNNKTDLESGLSRLISRTEGQACPAGKVCTMGATSITAALVQGHHHLKTWSTDPEKKKIILLFTDGRINTKCSNQVCPTDEIDGMGVIYNMCGVENCEEQPPGTCAGGNIDQPLCAEEKSYRDVAAKIKNSYEMVSIFFGPTQPTSNKETWGYYQLQNYVSSGEGLIQSEYNQQAIVDAFLKAADIITACPSCRYTSKARVEKLEKPDQSFELTGTGQVVTQSVINGVSSPPLDFYSAAPVGFSQVDWTTTQLDEKVRGTSNSVELTTIPSGYEIVGRFCEEYSATKGCPTGLSDKRETIAPAATNKLTGFNLTCNANIAYGWVIKPKRDCSYGSIIEIHDESGNVISTTADKFKTTSYVDDQNLGETVVYTNGLATKTYPPGPLSEKYEQSNNVKVVLSTHDLNYEIVGTFCTNTATGKTTEGCFPTSGISTDKLTLTGFDLACGYNLKYGWVVKAAQVQPPVCDLKKTGETSTEGTASATFDGSASKDPKQDRLTYRWTFSDNYSAGNTATVYRSVTSAVTATLQVCNTKEVCSTNLCTQTLTPGVVNKEPICKITTNPTPAVSKVPPPFTVQFDGSGSYDPEGKTLTYSWKFADNSTAATSKVSKTFDAVVSGKATLTVTDEGGKSKSCEVAYSTTPQHYTCNSKYQCVLVDGAGEDGCEYDVDCLPEYDYMCETSACVRVFKGDSRVKACASGATDNYCRCDPDVKNVCREPEEPDTGVSGAALAVGVVAIALFLMGLRWIF